MAKRAKFISKDDLIYNYMYRDILMQTAKYHMILNTAALFVGLGLSALGYAENYYRWVGPDGVVHYGSRPPEGVQAERISTYGKSSPGDLSGNGPVANEKVAENTYTDKQKELVEERKAQCDQERERLDALKSAGSRIQMDQGDGTTRYLSPDEVIKEISSSEKFISQACK